MDVGIAEEPRSPDPGRQKVGFFLHLRTSRAALKETEKMRPGADNGKSDK